jgi:hypothetical protein
MKAKVQEQKVVTNITNPIIFVNITLSFKKLYPILNLLKKNFTFIVIENHEF